MINENTNKVLLINSVILYSRVILTTVFAILSTRYALQALGVVDFGLFSLIGSVISFIAIINTIMLSTSNRYIAVAIGRGDEDEIREQFNINLIIHIVVAIIALISAFPIGECYMNNHLNFDGNIDIAKKIFYISVIGSVISFISVPYNGILMAKENFLVFCLTETICSLLKLVLTLLLLCIEKNALIIYAIGLSVLSAVPTLVYFIYCREHYPKYVKFCIVKNREKYRDVLSFSAWVGYGAVACVGKSQGAALLVNMFFNTILNTALGIATNINSMITMVANVIVQPIAPQLTKSYSAGDFIKANDLLVFSIKVGYFSMLIVGLPILIQMDWILRIWLGEVPPYAVLFSRLIIIDALVCSLYSSISTIIFADGNIKLYQVTINTLRLLSIAVGYFVLKNGFPSEYMLLIYIVFSFIAFMGTLYVLKLTLRYDIKSLLRSAYLPIFLVTISSTPIFFLPIKEYHILSVLFIVLYVIFSIYLMGLSVREKIEIHNILKRIVWKIRRCG